MAESTEWTVPAYRDLEVHPQLGLPHAWNVFGAGDRLGTVNHLSPAGVLAGVSSVTEGLVVTLDLPLDAISPALFGRATYQHTVTNPSRNVWEDEIDHLNTQSSTQWDALGHIQCREFGFYGGRTDLAQVHSELGIDAYAERGIVGRGILLDLAARVSSEADDQSARGFTAADLADSAREQGTTLRRGDILCIRTGWMQQYLGLDAPGRERMAATPRWPGLTPDVETARFLWDSGIAAVAADNPAVECSGPGAGSLHRQLLPLLGMAMGELFDFEDAARACARRGSWEFLFVSAPLKLRGGRGSPANALAIF